MKPPRKTPDLFDSITIERFQDCYIPEPYTGCWLWTGVTNPGGYGRFSIAGKNYAAHRISKAISGSEVPETLLCDHKCRVRCCVNPDHLRMVTAKVNAIENSTSVAAINAAKTHCDNGHELNESNSIFTTRDGHKWRKCKICQREHDRIHKINYRANPPADKAVLLICPTCSNPFTRIKSEYDRQCRVGRPSFCSLGCKRRKRKILDGETPEQKTR